MGQNLPVENYTPPEYAPTCSIQRLVELQMPGTGRREAGGVWRVALGGCKGTYACVRPHRYTYGIYWHTVANVDASDSRCRCIGKIIARDLRLVASRLDRMAVTRPGHVPP
jgi:hypothetical protein